MIGKWLAYLLGGVVLVGSGIYVFVYLYRWEWHRALVSGVLFLAAEIGLATALVLKRLSELNRRLDQGVSDHARREALSQVRSAAPPPQNHFDWLRRSSERMGVFVPVLLGAGMVASALAWVVERVARATAGSVLEHSLATRLARLAWPVEGLASPEPDDDLTPPRALIRQA
jgi:hypothetical protein